MRLVPEQVDAVNEIIFSKIKQERQKLTMMERNAQEDEMADWFEDHGAEDGYEIAENFAEFGLTIDDVEHIDEILEGQHVVPVFNWLNNVLITERLVMIFKERLLVSLTW